jgi:predicted RNA-binding Zn-ribbon protein involved in translation (DUF1610 family)
MKTRRGFVSNSSSTSFYCPICNIEFSGWDWDEDPVCPDCGIHINNVETFVDYICEKHNLNQDEEFENYKKDCKHEN